MNKRKITIFILFLLLVLAQWRSRPMEIFANKEVFRLWINFVSTATFFIIFVLWIANVWSDYKELRSRKIPRPVVLTIKRLSITKLLLLPVILLMRFGKATHASKLKGRQIWFSWDIRWGPCGSGVATIGKVIRKQNGYVFLIRLEEPIELSSESKPIEKAIFKPSKMQTPLSRYYLTSVYGTLLFGNEIENVENYTEKHDLVACEIVVY